MQPGIRNIPQGESKKTPKFLAPETGKSSSLLRAARKDINGFVFLICPGLLARAGHIMSVSETPYESLSTKAHCLWTTLRSPCLPLHHSLFSLAHPHFLACCQTVDLPLPSPLTPPRPCLGATHHPDGPEGHELVTAVTAGPGVPARVLAFLQDEHLTPEIGLLKCDPAGHEWDGEGGVGQRQKREQLLAETHPLPLECSPKASGFDSSLCHLLAV